MSGLPEEQKYRASFTPTLCGCTLHARRGGKGENGWREKMSREKVRGQSERGRVSELRGERLGKGAVICAVVMMIETRSTMVGLRGQRIEGSLGYLDSLQRTTPIGP